MVCTWKTITIFLMRRLFGKKKEEAPPPSLSETSERLGSRSQKLEQDLADVNKKIQEKAKELKLPANRGRQPAIKRQIMTLIKRRKTLEAQLGRVDQQRFNVEQIAFNQEQIQANIDTVNAMKANAAVMQKQMKDITIEGVEDAMFDMDEIMADANEISDILAGSLGENFDEDELEGEFAALEAELGDEGVSLDGIGEAEAPSTSAPMPSYPTQ